jgi:hypothetical protein
MNAPAPDESYNFSPMYPTNNACVNSGRLRRAIRMPPGGLHQQYHPDREHSTADDDRGKPRSVRHRVRDERSERQAMQSRAMQPAPATA